MSGIEVAGLVLGAFPILLEAIDVYKDGIRKIEKAFRKRKYIEKLARALLLQQQILEEAIKSVLVASGCENIGNLDDDPISYLEDEHTQEQVLEFLGRKNNVVFNGTLDQSIDIIKRISRSVVGLLPDIKCSTDDLLGIITANREAKPRQIDLLQRVKLLFGISEIKEILQELDETTTALSNFARIVVSNRQTIDSTSRKAVKLARALQQIQDMSKGLYSALLQSWKANCHNKHEVKLFLEDRVDVATDILKSKTPSVPILAFQLLFAAFTSHEQVLWHETAVQVYTNDLYEDPCLMGSQSPFAPKVTIVAPQIIKPGKPEAAFVGDICGAIEATRCDQRQVTFILTDKQQIGIIPTERMTLVAHNEPDITTLKDLILAGSALGAPRHGPILPLKLRMLLALKLSSNLLQLLQTRWLERSWSKDMVHFLIRQGTVDVVRPFVSLTFDGTTPSHPQPQTDPKLALLELGIVLLEIWHETTLEVQSSLTEEAPTGYYERLMLAVKWFDDMSNPLPELYGKAVYYCLHRTVECGSLEFEHRKLREAICSNVIEPLSKICKQWI
ncbi:hypothetical protein BP5796_12956 [Coleophoma crateriformis]|uniref:DUF7580 domain-containing protein n=1 Tax=Coleophoma crateriformis TaxID=565419 RepID=A0A3D8Q4Z0_9HELO|nr:hypothetical protein BP5796_12956 [Coleophoma crateriformis]